MLPKLPAKIVPLGYGFPELPHDSPVKPGFLPYFNCKNRRKEKHQRKDCTKDDVASAFGLQLQTTHLGFLLLSLHLHSGRYLLLHVLFAGVGLFLDALVEFVGISVCFAPLAESGAGVLHYRVIIRIIGDYAGLVGQRTHLGRICLACSVVLAYELRARKTYVSFHFLGGTAHQPQSLAVAPVCLPVVPLPKVHFASEHLPDYTVIVITETHRVGLVQPRESVGKPPLQYEQSGYVTCHDRHSRTHLKLPCLFEAAYGIIQHGGVIAYYGRLHHIALYAEAQRRQRGFHGIRLGLIEILEGYHEIILGHHVIYAETVERYGLHGVVVFLLGPHPRLVKHPQPFFQPAASHIKRTHIGVSERTASV